MKPASDALVLLCAAVALVAAGGAFAQGMQMHAHHEGGAASAYSPGLGEIMALQQMRHSKLWFAGRARNWELAAYELDELKEGFEDVGKYFPTHEDMALTPMVDAIIANEIPALDKAIEAKSGGKFSATFDRLTTACNSCHTATHHGFIAIRRPTSTPYSNQSFAPQK